MQRFVSIKNYQIYLISKVSKYRLDVHTYYLIFSRQHSKHFYQTHVKSEICILRENRVIPGKAPKLRNWNYVARFVQLMHVHVTSHAH